MSGIAASYASPFAKSPYTLSEVIVPEYSGEVLQAFASHCHVHLKGKNSPIATSLAQNAKRLLSFEAAWQYPFGSAEATLLNKSKLSLDLVAITLLLDLQISHVATDWEAHLENPVRLRYGTSVLPQANELRVLARNGTTEITLVSQGRPSIICFKDAELISGDGVDELPRSTAEGTSWTGLLGDVITSTEFLKLRNDVDSSNILNFTNRVQRASEVMRLYSKRYYLWTRQVLRYLVPLLPRDANIYDSGSSRFAPGIIYLTNIDEPIQIADTLVHESSHQLFYVLQRLLPLCDPSDKNLYYSAVKKVGRPPIMILLAYHALANVYLFYREAHANGLPQSPELDRYQSALRDQVAGLENELLRIQSLTEAGGELWRSLAALLSTA